MVLPCSDFVLLVLGLLDVLGGMGMAVGNKHLEHAVDLSLYPRVEIGLSRCAQAAESR